MGVLMSVTQRDRLVVIYKGLCRHPEGTEAKLGPGAQARAHTNTLGTKCGRCAVARRGGSVGTGNHHSSTFRFFWGKPVCQNSTCTFHACQPRAELHVQQMRGFLVRPELRLHPLSARCHQLQLPTVQEAEARLAVKAGQPGKTPA